MFRFKKQIISVISFCVLAVVMISSSYVFAATPYNSYTYDSYGNAAESPDAYGVERVVYGKNIGVTDILSPTDMVIAENGDIYILDSGNARIIVTDINFALKKIISDFTLDNESSPLKEPQGLAVKDDRIFVADKGNQRVVCCDFDGRINTVITKPDSDVFENHVEFLPYKISVDKNDNIYIQSLGIYQGLMIYDKNFKFCGFYGSELVTTTSEAIKQYIWKQFMTSEQKDAMANYVPNEIKNMYIASDGFVFTVTNASFTPLTSEKVSMDSIRRLNPEGSDTLVNKMSPNALKAFSEDAKELNFVDICADNDGFITVIDNAKGEILQFDNYMNLVVGFGALGQNQGMIKSPSAIDTYGGKLYALDSSNGSVTVYELTEFGKKIHNALIFHNNGDYESAIEPWKEVLKIDSNYELAHIGIGNAYYNRQEYTKAMAEYKLARDNVRYNDAFREYRIIFIRNNFKTFIAILVVLIVFSWVFKRRTELPILKKYFKTVKRERKQLNKYQYPFYAMFHPNDGFDEIRYRKKTSLLFAFGAVIFLSLSLVFAQQYQGLQFNMADSADVNILLTLFVCFAGMLIFTAANWSFCVFLEGKATFKEIFIMTAYSTMPFAFCSILRTVVSNVLTLEENLFLVIITIVGCAWSLWMILAAFMNFHQYELSRSILALILTAVGMAIILALLFLLYSLAQQLFGNGMTIFNEIVFRMREG